MNQKQEKKKKKEKIVYVDDGSRIADMSMLRPQEQERTDPTQKPRPRWRQILDTYFESVRLMLLPMLAFLGIVTIAFVIIVQAVVVKNIWG